MTEQEMLNLAADIEAIDGFICDIDAEVKRQEKAQGKQRLTVIDQLNDAEERGVQFVTYGYGDLGVPVAIDDAIKDFEAMEDWPEDCNVDYGVDGLFPCDEAGTIQ